MKAIFLIAVVALFSACGAKSGDTNPPVQPTVDATAFKGTPGEFAALYTGTCTIQTADRVYTNCSTRVRIRHRGNQLIINTQFLLNPSSRVADEPSLIGRDTMIVVQNGSDLLQPTTGESLGEIGERGFQIQKSGAQYYFARLYPATYEYAGTFTVDGTNEVVQVKGLVKRGAALEQPITPHRHR